MELERIEWRQQVTLLLLGQGKNLESIKAIIEYLEPIVFAV